MIYICDVNFKIHAMKKTFLSILALIGMVAILNAQDVKNKNGFAYLPEAGEYALGIDATPVFNFFGNFIKINSALKHIILFIFLYHRKKNIVIVSFII